MEYFKCNQSILDYFDLAKNKTIQYILALIINDTPVIFQQCCLSIGDNQLLSKQ